MTLRRYAPLALALAALTVGCQPKIDSRENPAFIDFVAFDLSREIDGVNTIIPQPNAVSLANAASLPVSAQRELLEAFVAAGGFPWEQEVAITIDFSRQLIREEAEKKVFTGTTIDTATVTPTTVAIVQIPTTTVPLAGAPELVTFDAAATTFTTGSGRGTLTLHKPKNAGGSRAWTAGAKYAVFVRGGANGVKVAGGGEIHAWPTMQVILSAAIAGKPLTDPANQGLLSGTPEEKAAAAARLEPIREGFASLIPAATALTGWTAEEIASIHAFDIAPSTGTVVVVDSGSGIAPLPFDVAREAIPTDTSKGLDAGLIKPNAAFGAAGAGLVTLDGFSTTAMILASTSGPITASTVAANVKVYQRGVAGAWTEVTALAKQPPNLVSGGFSTAIGLQPAVWAGTFPLPPLAENTKYAVVVGKGVTSATGTPLVRSTFAKLLLEMTQPVVAPWPVTQGTSPVVLTPLLAGMDGQTAAAIQKMRGELDELITDQSLVRGDIATAYTFKTQTVTATSVSVTAAPYGFESAAGAALFTPATVTAIAPAAMETLAGFPAGSFPDVASFYTTTITTPNGLDLASGTLARPQSAWLTPGNTVKVLVAAPFEPQVTAQLAPLVVFHHGITRMKEDVLTIANILAARGFVVAAIDAPYHGSRSNCNDDADCGAGGTCTPVVAGAALSSVPGTCTAGALQPSASGNYFVSGNFFRTRDAIRQDLMDQSALVLALARPASSPAPAANDLATALAALGVGYAVDPTRVYFVGQSLGGIVGAEMLATNPRFGRGVLNVAGGTLTDIFTTAPDFRVDVEALFSDVLRPLLTALGLPAFEFAMLNSANPVCDPAAGTPIVTGCYTSRVAQEYLKTVNVAKWILDPADPINYAAYVETGLASSLDPLGPATTEVFGMAAQGDTTVPNANNFELYGLASGLDQRTYVGAGSVDGALVDVGHGFLLQGASLNATLAAQADAADFLETLPLPNDELLGTPGFQVILP